MMGTNYYWHPEVEVCECCGRPKEDVEPIHIGKSSAGWVFSLHVDPDAGICNLEDWVGQWKTPGKIIDEYDRIVSVPDMLMCILHRHGIADWDKPPPSYNSWIEFHRKNYSMQGPNNLLRSNPVGHPCKVKHGPSTYDLHEGEFS
jgi:hypothetical protein